jgi:predicted AAA+ superfamily ATPase
VAILELWPFSQAEWHSKRGMNLDVFCHPRLDLAGLRAMFPPSRACCRDWVAEAVMRSGFPEPAGFKEPRQRQTWFESYLNTYLRRDVMDLVRIEHVAEYTRLIRLLTLRTGQLLNISAIARDLGLPQPTVRRYAEWLRITYQCFELAPYSGNFGKRLVRMPKHYWVDSGMAAALLGFKKWKDIESAQLSGPLIETWLAGELRKWGTASGHPELYFWRSHDGGEVDFVLEIEGEIIGIEVKTGHRLDKRDLAGMHECRRIMGKRFRRGIVFYGGDEIMPLDDKLIAIPMTWFSGAVFPSGD